MRAAPGSSRPDLLAIRSRRRKVPSFLFQCYPWLKMDLLTAHLDQQFMFFFLKKSIISKRKMKKKREKSLHFIILISRLRFLSFPSPQEKSVRYIDRRRILQSTSELHEQVFKCFGRSIYPIVHESLRILSDFQPPRLISPRVPHNPVWMYKAGSA